VESITAPELSLHRPNPVDPPPECPAHRAGGISRVRLPTGQVAWLVSRYEDIRALAVDPRISSHLNGLGTVSHEPVPRRHPNAPEHITNLDGAAHRRFRLPIARHFTARRLTQLAEYVRETADACFAEMERHGPGVDLVRTLAMRVPSDTICRLFGLPVADQGTFHELATLALGGFARSEEEQRAAGPRMFGYLAGIVADKHEHPDDGLFSDLVHGGYGFTDEEVLVLSGTLLVAGFDTTANMLALGTYALLDQRDQWDALAAAPDRAEAVGEELMRYLTVMQRGILRRAATDFDHAGTHFAEDDLVLLFLAAGDRDPDLVADPDVLDVTREPVRHLGFGYGPHQCIGQQLARLEMSVVWSGLVRRFPGLRLAVPAAEIRFRSDTVVFGVEELPVTW
jgi:cytochrome P450